MGRYLPTALAQYELAWKLLAVAQDGELEASFIDRGSTYVMEGDPNMMIVLSEQTFDNNDDFIIALENNVSVAFGAAIICLNRALEEAGFSRPDPIASEIDQFISITYQIRNAFAHDISEPRWNITRDRYRRSYSFGGFQIDLSQMENGTAFDWSHIGGPDVIFGMFDFYSSIVGEERRVR